MTLFNACCRSFRGSDVKAPLDAVIPQEKIGPLYDKISRFYDVWGRLTESKARERALALADIRDGAAVLEAAVGTGLAFERIVGQNPHGRNMGVDLSQGMLAKARRRLWRAGLHNYALVQGSAAALETASDSVDVLVNSYMFDLIPFRDMDAVLAEFWRVIKPGGRLVLVNMTTGQEMGSGLYERLYRLFPRAMGGCRGVALAGRLTRAGFKVLRREYVRQLWFPSEVILAVKAGKERSL